MILPVARSAFRKVMMCWKYILVNSSLSKSFQLSSIWTFIGQWGITCNNKISHYSGIDLIPCAAFEIWSAAEESYNIKAQNFKRSFGCTPNLKGWARDYEAGLKTTKNSFPKIINKPYLAHSTTNS